MALIIAGLKIPTTVNRWKVEVIDRWVKNNYFVRPNHKRISNVNKTNLARFLNKLASISDHNCIMKRKSAINFAYVRAECTLMTTIMRPRVTRGERVDEWAWALWWPEWGQNLELELGQSTLVGCLAHTAHTIVSLV